MDPTTGPINKSTASQPIQSKKASSSPIPTLAQASLANLTTDSVMLTKKVTHNTHQFFPFHVLRKMSPEEAAQNVLSFNALPREDLNQMPTDLLYAVAPELPLGYFRAFSKRLIADLDYKQIAKLPLMFQLELLSQKNDDGIKRIILNTLLAYISKPNKPPLSDEDIEVIKRMLDLRVFNLLSREEAKQFNRNFWQIVSQHMPKGLRGAALSQSFEHSLGTMPLDLLEKRIALFDPSKEENCPSAFLDISKQIESLQLTPETAKSYQNLISFLKKGHQHFFQKIPEFLEKIPSQEDLPPLPAKIAADLDVLFRGGDVRLIASAEVKLGNDWIKQLEQMNQKIEASGIIEEYDVHASPLLHFILLTKRLDSKLREAGIDVKKPREGQFLWECQNLDRVLEVLKPIAKEKQRSFEALVNAVIDQNPEIDKILHFRNFKCSTSREKWNYIMRDRLHYKIIELNLSGKDLKFLPVEINDLINLKRLNLEGNKLGSLPPGVEDLHKLVYLNLENNLFTSIPQAVRHVQTIVI